MTPAHERKAKNCLRVAASQAHVVVFDLQQAIEGDATVPLATLDEWATTLESAFMNLRRARAFLANQDPDVLRETLREVLRRPTNLVPPDPPPRYDDVFTAGTKALNADRGTVRSKRKKKAR